MGRGLRAARVALAGQFGGVGRGPCVGSAARLVVDARRSIQIVVVNLFGERLGAGGPIFGSAVIADLRWIAHHVVSQLLVLEDQLKRAGRGRVVPGDRGVVRWWAGPAIGRTAIGLHVAQASPSVVVVAGRGLGVVAVLDLIDQTIGAARHAGDQ